MQDCSAPLPPLPWGRCPQNQDQSARQTKGHPGWHVYIRHRDISRSSRVPVAGKIQSYRSAALGQNTLSHVIYHATGKLIYHRTVHFKISLNVYVGRTPATAATSEAGCMPFNSCQSITINGRRRWERGRKRVVGERVNTGGMGGKICRNIWYTEWMWRG